MEFIFFWVNPQNYIQSLIYLLIGCLILGFGVYVEVFANVVMLPGEGTVKSITRSFGTDFGTTKVGMDVTMSIIALMISLALTHQIQGVRKGTIIAALLVGYISRFFSCTKSVACVILGIIFSQSLSLSYF